MKHLKVLEEAGLVVTRRRGREKLHFLNPVPIRLVHDRWVSKYAEGERGPRRVEGNEAGAADVEVRPGMGNHPAVERAFSIRSRNSPVSNSSRVMSQPPMNSPPM